ncbi:hypothetical protein C0W92_17775 [Photobacterium angustum]|uniref:Uncharacterized protein n=1 Tax=Photobacterium angustum TaxID=661 RepID=A0A855SN71_PHOAN|nr:hypothetical protein [Photobacterium angustum]KJF82355.1 hypothetical protein UB36_06055 [Photobacterium damselae subsp. damselae]KJG03240.1 hypothetical protein UB35_00020 [Photobacterium angustum]KJG07741.1 hypothetical protein UB33_02195 [Photobacterium angustum]KJG34292.1 hypothetical protein UA69_00420 [Photobacterium angustum]KJG35365.1 hypothetical protein UA32_20555 [Photobacterium angustum]
MKYYLAKVSVLVDGNVYSSDVKAESFLERDMKVAGLQEDLGPQDSVVSIDYSTSRIHSENK